MISEASVLNLSSDMTALKSLISKIPAYLLISFHNDEFLSYVVFILYRNRTKKNTERATKYNKKDNYITKLKRINTHFMY